MTKAELNAALAEVADDQFVCVLLYSDLYPAGSQVIIQDVVTFPPWYGEKKLVGLRAHAGNATVPAVVDGRGMTIVTGEP